MSGMFKVLSVPVLCASLLLSAPMSLAAEEPTDNDILVQVVEPFEIVIIPEEIEETEPELFPVEEIENESEPEPLFHAMSISQSDKDILCRIAMAEAEDQGTKGMALVMRVVLNRVNSKSWPNTIQGVVFQKGQFTPISDGRYYKVKPNASCYEALSWIENGWDESQGAQYFCMAGSSKWHSTHLTRLFQYKDHVFYK